MLINKSGAMLVIGRIKIRTGECVPGITLTAGEKQTIEAFKKVGYLVEDKPEVKAETTKAETKAEAKAEAKVEIKAEKAEKQK